MVVTCRQCDYEAYDEDGWSCVENDIRDGKYGGPTAVATGLCPLCTVQICAQKCLELLSQVEKSPKDVHAYTRLIAQHLWDIETAAGCLQNPEG